MPFTDELAREGQRWWADVRIAGWGRRINASNVPDRRVPYRWSTLDPGDHGYSNSTADPYVPALRLPPGMVEEAIDIREGKTGLGQLVFSLMDVPGPTRNTDHGWLASDLITDLLATERQVDTTNGPWSLAASVSDTAAVWTLTSVAGLAVDDILWIEAEAVAINSIAGGPVQITVERSVHGTEARAHSTEALGGEGVLYDHPRFVRGREVTLYVNLFNAITSHAHPTHEALSAGQAKVVGYWRIVDWDQADENVYEFVCAPSMGRLDGTVGREQYSTHLGLLDGDRDEASVAILNSWMERDEARKRSFVVPKSHLGVPVQEPQYTFSGAGDARKMVFHARMGRQIVEAEYAKPADADPPHATFNIAHWGLRPGRVVRESTSDVDIPFRDIWISNPGSRRIDPTNSEWFGPTLGGVKSTHPIDLALCLITSTGTAAANGDWDAAPEHWARAYPVGRINLQTFRDVKQRWPALTMPNLRLGWHGEPVPLLPWLEQHVTGPLGWYFYHDEDGALSLGELADIYALSSLPTITEADLVDRHGNQAVRPAWAMGALDSTTGWQTYRLSPKDLDWGEMLQTIRRRAPEAHRYPDEPADISFELPGLGPDGAQVVFDRAERFSHWWHTPLPRIGLRVGIHRLELSITGGVSLTVSTVPDPFTGARGLTTQPAIITKRRLDLSHGVIELECILVPSRNVGLWAGSATVVSYAAGPPPVVTFSANVHTDTDAGGLVPDRDVLAFESGYLVMLTTSRLAVRSDNQVTIAVAPETDGANTLRLSGEFELAAVPVAPVAGDIVTFMHWSTGGTPNAVWTSAMQDHVAQADDADDELPDGSDPYVYGA